MSFCVRYVSAVNPAGSKFAANDQNKKATKKMGGENQHAEWPREKITCLRAREKVCVVTSLKSQHSD